MLKYKPTNEQREALDRLIKALLDFDLQAQTEASKSLDDAYCEVKRLHD